MIFITTRDELAHIMNGETTICICKRQTWQIMSLSLIRELHFFSEIIYQIQVQYHLNNHKSLYSSNYYWFLYCINHINLL